MGETFWAFARRGSQHELYLMHQIASEQSWYMDVVTPAQFRRELGQCKGPLTVWINSLGGDYFAASDIYTALRDYDDKVTVKITGIAASAASLIAMAADEVLMSPLAHIMIHCPYVEKDGVRVDSTKYTNTLEEIAEAMVGPYEVKTGKSRDEIMGMMQATTYMNAHTAIREGFADGMLFAEDGEGISACAESNDSVAIMAQALASGMVANMATPPPPETLPPPEDQPAPNDEALRQEIALRAALCMDGLTQ